MNIGRNIVLSVVVFQLMLGWAWPQAHAQNSPSNTLLASSELGLVGPGWMDDLDPEDVANLVINNLQAQRQEEGRTPLKDAQMIQTFEGLLVTMLRIRKRHDHAFGPMLAVLHAGMDRRLCFSTGEQTQAQCLALAKQLSRPATAEHIDMGPALFDPLTRHWDVFIEKHFVQVVHRGQVLDLRAWARRALYQAHARTFYAYLNPEYQRATLLQGMLETPQDGYVAFQAQQTQNNIEQALLGIDSKTLPEDVHTQIAPMDVAAFQESFAQAQRAIFDHDPFAELQNIDLTQWYDYWGPTADGEGFNVSDDDFLQAVDAGYSLMFWFGFMSELEAMFMGEPVATMLSLLGQFLLGAIGGAAISKIAATGAPTWPLTLVMLGMYAGDVWVNWTRFEHKGNILGLGAYIAREICNLLAVMAGGATGAGLRAVFSRRIKASPQISSARGTGGKPPKAQVSKPNPKPEGPSASAPPSPQATASPSTAVATRPSVNAPTVQNRALISPELVRVDPVTAAGGMTPAAAKVSFASSLSPKPKVHSNVAAIQAYHADQSSISDATTIAGSELFWAEIYAMLMGTGGLRTIYDYAQADLTDAQRARAQIIAANKVVQKMHAQLATKLAGGQVGSSQVMPASRPMHPTANLQEQVLMYGGVEIQPLRIRADLGITPSSQSIQYIQGAYGDDLSDDDLQSILQIYEIVREKSEADDLGSILDALRNGTRTCDAQVQSRLEVAQRDFSRQAHAYGDEKLLKTAALLARALLAYCAGSGMNAFDMSGIDTVVGGMFSSLGSNLLDDGGMGGIAPWEWIMYLVSLEKNIESGPGLTTTQYLALNLMLKIPLEGEWGEALIVFIRSILQLHEERDLTEDLEEEGFLEAAELYRDLYGVHGLINALKATNPLTNQKPKHLSARDIFLCWETYNEYVSNYGPSLDRQIDRLSADELDLMDTFVDLWQQWMSAQVERLKNQPGESTHNSDVELAQALYEIFKHYLLESVTNLGHADMTELAEILFVRTNTYLYQFTTTRRIFTGKTIPRWKQALFRFWLQVPRSEIIERLGSEGSAAEMILHAGQINQWFVVYGVYYPWLQEFFEESTYQPIEDWVLSVAHIRDYLMTLLSEQLGSTESFTYVQALSQFTDLFEHLDRYFTMESAYTVSREDNTGVIVDKIYPFAVRLVPHHSPVGAPVTIQLHFAVQFIDGAAKVVLLIKTEQVDLPDQSGVTVYRLFDAFMLKEIMSVIQGLPEGEHLLMHLDRFGQELRVIPTLARQILSNDRIKIEQGETGRSKLKNGIFEIVSTTDTVPVFAPFLGSSANQN